MAHPDIARIGTDERKRYVSTGMQQGRPITEDDWNENSRLTAEEQRRVVLDVVGASGSPDGGFLIDDPKIAGGALDVRIGAGTLYLGGERLEMPAPERYLTQSDWLEQTAADGVAPPAANATRTTLAYLEAWQQTITAPEDAELFEPALGSPDTSTRERMMRRVHLADVGAATTCTNAWSALTASWKAQKLGAVGAGGERVVDTTLTVTLVQGTPAGDLCNPPVAGGYLGAENQAIRVQLVDATHLTWGFDNASPLYRVTLETDQNGALTVVKFVTTPKDHAHWPLQGMVVELLAWSAVLANGEKLAENGGFLTRVALSYAPGTPPTIGLADAVPATFGTAPFYYLRVWDRGGDLASPPAMPFAFGAPVGLGTTGLAVTLGGNDAAPGDFWVIGARPATPDRVVPWRLLGAAPPHGLRRFYTPLALITWTSIDGKVASDCRETFVPLTRLRGCCTVTVGDGIISYGDVNTVQAGVDALPPDGGEVCIKPGTYPGFVSIANRTNVVIEGCGERTVLTPPVGDASTTPVITIDASTNVTIRELAVRATTGPGIEWSDPNLVPKIADVTLNELEIDARDMSAIFGRNAARVRVERCDIRTNALAAETTAASTAGMIPAVFLSGDDLLVERNTIRYVGDSSKFGVMPLGGLQIGGGSERVDVRRNVISGGLANGITLGSVSYTTIEALQKRNADGFTSDGSYTGSYTPYSVGFDAGGCIQVGPPDGGTPPQQGKPRAISDGDLTRVRIVDNTIEGMGNDGIASVRFYDARGVFITVDEVWIEQNLIRDNVLIARAGGDAAIRARGGIALASVELATIRENTIAANGVSLNEPMCGIYVQRAGDLDVSLNRIDTNGARSELVPSIRNSTVGGGIVVDLALPSQISFLAHSLDMKSFNTNEFSWGGGVAARIEENEVVAPNGRALEIVAAGEVSVHGNSFAAFSTHDVDLFEALLGGGSGRPLDVLGGGVVAVLNLGISDELGSPFIGFAAASLLQNLDASVLANEQRPKRIGGGDVLFHDNQCELNLLQTRFASPLSAVLLLSADDVSMQNNQCNVLAPLGQPDIVFVHVLAFAVSVRLIGNRMKEGLLTYLSAVTLGMFNTTTHNQGTHCFLALPLVPKLLVVGENSSFSEVLPPPFGQTCGNFTKEVSGNMSFVQ